MAEMIGGLVLIVCCLGVAIAFRLRSSRKSAVVVVQPAAPKNAVPAKPQPPILFQGMTTHDLHQRIRDLARHHALDERELPIIYFPHDGEPYVQVRPEGFHWACYDRGQMSGARLTQDLDEMLYWVVDYTTYRMASAQTSREITHYNQFAPQMLPLQDAMLAAISPDWHRRWLMDPLCFASRYRQEILNR